MFFCRRNILFGSSRRFTQPALSEPSGSVRLSSAVFSQTAVVATPARMAPFAYPPMAPAKPALYVYKPPAWANRIAAVISYIRPLKSLPCGGIPPAETAVMVTGGKPESYAALPLSLVCCVALSGIRFLSPVLAKGTASWRGLSLAFITGLL
ncbi:Uncharacterised protein [Shigella sonnei]|nr:Uncharacterised protein [Shigella sonnei]